MKSATRIGNQKGQGHKAGSGNEFSNTEHPAHTGLLRCGQTLAVARDFPKQVWLDVLGQAVPNLKTILDRFDCDRIYIGPDRPFHPLDVAMSRSLAAAENCPDYRGDLFYQNGARFLGLTS